ncbi:class I mannose-6-phosphate isomerase [Oligoflexaceae bacterium]|nr:class I mannose-6-phosphate isomerase [Oligoflexaceae bacterium]
MSEIKSPLWLDPKNFTPLTRTPWAGEKIAQLYKDQILALSDSRLIGESWEVSCDPQFPSYVSEWESDLQSLLEKYPATLGPLKEKATCEILSKIINASSPLSFQIHPADDDANLESNECGKPESWYIMHAEKDSGIYLGFQKQISREQFLEILESPEDDLKKYLQFVPVKSGDYFELSPGVPHAIGAGVTLFEPQRILKGKSGKTFRLFDWNRRYDKEGKLSSGGEPRELHVAAGARLINFEQAFGEQYLQTIRREPKTVVDTEGLQINSYPDNGYYQVSQLFSNDNLELSLDHESYMLLTILSGSVQHSDQREMGRGNSAFVPANLPSKHWSFTPNTQVALVTPSGFPLLNCQKD